MRKSKSSAEGPDEEEGGKNNQLGGSWGERGHDGLPPVQGNGQHGEHADRHGGEGDELVDGAVEGAKVTNSEDKIV